VFLLVVLEVAEVLTGGCRPRCLAGARCGRAVLACVKERTVRQVGPAHDWHRRAFASLAAGPRPPYCTGDARSRKHRPARFSGPDTSQPGPAVERGLPEGVGLQADPEHHPSGRPNGVPGSGVASIAMIGH